MTARFSLLLCAVSLSACHGSDGASRSPPSLEEGGDAAPIQVEPDASGDSETGVAPVPHEDTRPCGANTLEAGTFELSFGGNDYGYIVHLPPGYDGTRRTPLVFNWHPFTASAKEEEAWTAMDPVADELGFIVVYPDSPDGTWNAGTCCAFEAPTRDDVGFARALLAEVSGRGCINSQRVYSTGMSNGGFMSYRLGCEAADLFAAIAPVSAKVGIPDCTPTRPVPVMAFHGTADSIIPYADTVASGEEANVPETVARWAERDGCRSGPRTTYRRGTEACIEWSRCDDGVTVSLCIATGGQHCWPGAPLCYFDPPTIDIDANREMAAFFLGFTLP